MLLAPESDLLIVETVERTSPAPRPVTPLFGPTPKPAPTPLGRPDDTAPVALSFYRLSMSEKGDEVGAKLAGVAHSAHFGEIAAMGVGHIAVVDEGRQQWGFDFRPFNGEVKQLAPFASSCSPTPRFVSSSEFVAFGCHGGSSPMVLAGFNMLGEEMWEQNLSGDYVGTFLSFAPESGRFALGRVLGDKATSDLLTAPSAVTGQSVVVYQTETGKQLLHIDCSPVSRAGQNFALSPDGMNLAVIREEAIEVYGLPPLSTKDLADVREARELVPQASLLPIDFAGPSPTPAATSPAPSEPASAKDASAAGSASPEAPKVASVPAAAPTPVAPQPPPQPPQPQPAASGATAGDDTPEQPRKPPTLYTLPGDKGGDAAQKETK
jgi:hypothetical protein